MPINYTAHASGYPRIRTTPDRIHTMSSKPGRPAREPASVLGDRRTPSKGERQRTAILETVADLLTTRSIADLTIGEIASAAGVLRSGFYFYFDSKFAPLAVLTSEIWSDLMEQAQSFVRFDSETVEQYLDRVNAVTARAWRTHDAVLIASIQAMPQDEQLADMWKHWNQRLADILTAQVLKDRDQGLAKPISEDVPTLVSSVLEMTMHMYYKDRLDQCTPEQTERTFAAVRAIWLASAWGLNTAVADTGSATSA